MNREARLCFWMWMVMAVLIGFCASTFYEIHKHAETESLAALKADIAALKAQAEELRASADAALATLRAGGGK